MTRKENALAELKEAILLFGNEKEANSVVGKFRKKSIWEIEDETARYKSMYNDKVLQDRIQEFFKSEEGAKKKAECEQRLAELKEFRCNYKDFSCDIIKKKFQTLIPSLNEYGYEVANLFDNSVVLRNDSHLDIEIRFWDFCEGKSGEFHPTINISACGSFLIEGDNTSKKYYLACFEILKNCDAVKEALKQAACYIDKLQSIQDEATAIREYMKNPFKNEQ